MSDFHFLRPIWFLAIFALIAVLYLVKKIQVSQSGWQKLLPKHLSNVLLTGNSNNKSSSMLLPFLVGLIAIIALAGPVWKKLPQPVYQLQQGSVLIMDMSLSMYSTDISPNRLTRARYKANDLLDSLNEGEMGLIAYAGDAFTISPLTEDINNIKLLLPSLTPDIMPELGSNPFAALDLAHKMLTNAGHATGNIFWFTDGIEKEDVKELIDWTNEHPYTLNILGIGTASGAPIKLPNGELMKDHTGAIIVPKLTESYLSGVAKRGQGVYQTISNNSGDIEQILAPVLNTNLQDKIKKESEESNFGDQWQEEGAWLVLLILPFCLYFFRRGVILSIATLMFLAPTERAMASLWDDLWKTPDQQAQAKFNKEKYVEAAQQFENSQWQGSAHYKAGDYEKALASFKQSDTAESLYNQGNAHAKLNQLDEAIKAYEQAIAKNPDFENAKANKKLIEDLKNQQEQQKGEGNNNQNNEEQEKSDEQNQSSDDQNSQQNSQQGENQDSQQNQQQESNAEQNESQNDSNNSESSSEQNQDSQSSQQENSEAQESENDKPEEQQSQATNEESSENGDEQSTQQAQLAEQLDKETEQKHKQLLKKVTDDPYLLLRNKMQLEYQKRRHEQSNSGVKKTW